jgi:6,7-dimethyl-8-ribityllumazine synthase
MATQLKKLSEYDLSGVPAKKVLAKQKYAIAVADWNPQITHTLLKGAVDTLLECGVEEKNIKVVHVPGTFELTYAAKKLCFEKGLKKPPHGIIVLGCVIQGDTPHFDYVCHGVTYGISKLNAAFLKDSITTLAQLPPVIFGVLTTNTLQQAEDRAGGIHGNKGVEAAITAIKMANIVW